MEKMVIGRCAVKGCNYAVKIPLSVVDWNGHRCTKVSEKGYKHENWPLNFREVKGTLKPEIKCDSRCTNARGHNCDCSCGGENHGSTYL